MNIGSRRRAKRRCSAARSHVRLLLGRRACYQAHMPPRHGFGLLLIVALAIAGCKRNNEPVPEGDIAATLTVPSIGAYTFDPASLKGKPSLIMFVTPTCPHCIAT